MGLPRLLFVTGKGGTGKSTVAAALALALANRGSTILADLDQRLTSASMARESLNGAARSHARLEVVALSARAELEAFIERLVPVKMISRRMLQSRTFGYVTAALPGLEAFLLLERLRLMASEAALEDRIVVVDGPASGSALELLSIARGVQGIAPAGALNRLAAGVEEFLHDRERFGTILTIAPEELAVREAFETAAALRDRLEIEPLVAIVNRAPAPMFETAELAALSAVPNHAALAIRRRAAHDFARESAEALRRAGIPAIELPMLYTARIEKRELNLLGRKLVAAIDGR